MQILINWLISTLAVIIAAYVLPGVSVDNFLAALAAAVVIGLINTILRPIILVLTLPVNLLTLGLFTFVINALLIMLADMIVPGFEVQNFWWALLFSLVLAIVNYFLKHVGSAGRKEAYDSRI